MGEKRNGRQVVDRLVERQVEHAKKSGKEVSSKDLKEFKKQAIKTRLRGEERRG